MTKHRWQRNDRGTGKCLHCKTRVKLVKVPKIHGDGKKTIEVFTTQEGTFFQLPPCVEK
jgi:hypothetical protein